MAMIFMSIHLFRQAQIQLCNAIRPTRSSTISTWFHHDDIVAAIDHNTVIFTRRGYPHGGNIDKCRTNNNDRVVLLGRHNTISRYECCRLLANPERYATSFTIILPPNVATFPPTQFPIGGGGGAVATSSSGASLLE